MQRWLRLAIGAAIVLIGWVFIAWQNKFHITPPLVFIVPWISGRRRDGLQPLAHRGRGRDGR